MINEFLNRIVAIDQGRTTKQELLFTLLNGESRLWIVWDDAPKAIVITSFRDYPGHGEFNPYKACSIDVCVGDDRKLWIALLSEIEQWASDNGASVMEIPFARPGWARDLSEYKKKRITLVKQL